MELLPPKAPIGMEDHEHSSFGLDEAGGHQGHQLQETLEVGEAAQRKGQRGQEFLVATLLLPQAVEQWRSEATADAGFREPTPPGCE